jgi:serine/threonine protein kinase
LVSIVAKNTPFAIGYNARQRRRGAGAAGETTMIGARLDSWILERELGRGGMGTVYLAHRAPSANGETSNALERAAIKVIAAELAVDAGFLARFQREIDILRQLDHPNIVRFHDSGQQNGRPFFVMEYIAGPSYETLLSRQSRLPWPDVLELAWQIAPALKHAHDRGVIHRDLKPSNLLRVKSGEWEVGTGEWKVESGEKKSLATRYSPLSTRVKLTDFGIASLFASPHLTVTGGIVGTAEYLSPEQAAGKQVTRRSDLYSLGVVLYTLVAGRTPFVGEPLDLLHKHRFAQFDRPIRLVPEMPHELDAIICDLMEKDPDKRPADAAVLFRRLDRLKRKLAYQATRGGEVAAQGTSAPSAAQSATRAPNNAEGPATLMSRLMRQELERERSGGVVRRFLHRPWVLALLLATTAALLVWAFWPMSAETSYQRGAALMQSEDPDDWETAWDKYLGPLLAKEPQTPHRGEIERWREKSETAKAARQANRTARFAGPMSEAQWFYQEGLRLRQQGDEAGARRVWQALARAFKDVPSEDPWLRLAEKEQNKDKPERQWSPVRQALRRARELRQRGEDKEAAKIVEGLRELYRGDKEAEAILNEK